MKFLAFISLLLIIGSVGCSRGDSTASVGEPEKEVIDTFDWRYGYFYAFDNSDRLVYWREFKSAKDLSLMKGDIECDIQRLWSDKSVSKITCGWILLANRIREKPCSYSLMACMLQNQGHGTSLPFLMEKKDARYSTITIRDSADDLTSVFPNSYSFDENERKVLRAYPNRLNLPD